MTNQEKNIENINDLLKEIKPKLEGKSYEDCMNYIYCELLATYCLELSQMSLEEFLKRAASTECGLVLEIVRLREERDSLNMMAE